MLKIEQIDARPSVSLKSGGIIWVVWVFLKLVLTMLGFFFDKCVASILLFPINEAPSCCFWNRGLDFKN